MSGAYHVGYLGAMRGDQEGLDEARVPRGGRRDRLRSNRATRQPYRIAVFTAGLLCIAFGAALIVLPGPLTIPPVLLGLWIWSWELRFAQKLFESVEEKAKEAWGQAKEKPVLSAVISGGGIIAAGVVMYTVIAYDVVDEAKAAVGL